MPTVKCPICGKLIEIPEYDRIARSDALGGHIFTVHGSKVRPTSPHEGPPLPRGLRIGWPWRK